MPSRPAASAPVRSPPAGPAPPSPLAGFAFVVLLCTLAVEWVSFGRLAGGNLKVFHLGATAFVATCALRRGFGVSVKRFLWSARGLYGCWALFLVVVALLGFLHSDPYFPRPELLRQIGYGATSVAVGAFFASGAGLDLRRVLRWSAFAVGATVILGLGYSAAKGGANPIALVGDALRAGDPDVMSRLFRVAFRSEGLEEANVNLRHKVFAAVLIGCFVTLAVGAGPMAGTERRWRLATGGAVAVGGVLVVGSLSRSLTLALGACLLLAAARLLLRGRARPRHLALLGVSVLVALTAFVSPVGGLLESRFVDETTSYSSRAEAARSSVDVFGASALTGAGAEAVDRSPHNLLLDAWLSGGVLGFALAAGWAFAFVRVWGREARRYLFSQPGWVLPVNQIAVVGLGLVPLVRLFTAGQGWHLTEWVAVGVVLGLVRANAVMLGGSPKADGISPRPDHRSPARGPAGRPGRHWAPRAPVAAGSRSPGTAPGRRSTVR